MLQISIHIVKVFQTSLHLSQKMLQTEYLYTPQILTLKPNPPSNSVWKRGLCEDV